MIDDIYVCVCVCVCERERERKESKSIVRRRRHIIQGSNIYHTVYVSTIYGIKYMVHIIIYTPGKFR